MFIAAFERGLARKTEQATLNSTLDGNTMLCHMVVKSLMTIVVATLLSGCVAFGVFYEDDEELKIESLKLGDRGFIYHWAEAPSYYTKTDFLAAWGEPDSINFTDGAEHWRYDGGLSWGGIFVIFIVIPVPIVFPVGSDTTELIFSDNTLSGVITDKQKHFGFECGWGIDGYRSCGFK